MAGRYSNKAKIRFWSKVTKTDSCWFYDGGLYFKLPSSRSKINVKRFAYVLTKESYPKNIHLMNLCGISGCINPNHHELRKSKSRVRKCYTCKEVVRRTFYEIAKSQSGKVFCSKSCSTSDKNKNKTKKWSELDNRGAIKSKWINENMPLKCSDCDFDGTFKPWCIEIDHILPIHLGGTTEINNLQPLCLNCHRDKTVRELKIRLNGL